MVRLGSGWPHPVALQLPALALQEDAQGQSLRYRERPHIVYDCVERSKTEGAMLGHSPSNADCDRPVCNSRRMPPSALTTPFPDVLR
eukprot:364783-Chlamydomonas_euryale.AAC.4